ncbi:MAG: hypothetical protein ACI86X_002380 [Moritella sp.]|jgi:hypothetical protein
MDKTHYVNWLLILLIYLNFIFYLFLFYGLFSFELTYLADKKYIAKKCIVHN